MPSSIGSASVAELALSESNFAAPAVDVIKTGNAVASTAAIGAASADQSAAAVAIASSFIIGSGAAGIGANVTALASSSALAMGCVDKESPQVGFALATALASAVIRLDGTSIVARATTRVLPVVEVTTEVLPLQTLAFLSVRADRVARSSVLPSTVTAESSPLENAAASSRSSD
jgi:hypothetical protein